MTGKELISILYTSGTGHKSSKKLRIFNEVESNLFCHCGWKKSHDERMKA